MRAQIEGAIRSGEYPPLSQLPSERQLTEMFGVSRVSVREAIRSLEAIGLVEVRHGNGCFVTEPSSRPGRELSRWVELHRDEVLDLLQVRGALDELAAREAARRHEPGDLAAVHAAHEAFLQAVSRGGELDELTELDAQFHHAIADASGNVLLSDLLGDLHEYLADSRRAGFEPEGRPEDSAAEHMSIVEAIDAGDANGAALATAAHIAQVRDLLGAIRTETSSSAPAPD